MVQVEPAPIEGAPALASHARKGSRWMKGLQLPFVRSFVVIAACVGLWALATPMFGSPDEPAHMVRAYAAVHGDLSGEVLAGSSEPQFLVPPVLVPDPPCYPFDGSEATYSSPCDVSVFDIPCYSFKPEVTADCLNVDDSGPSAFVPSRTANYPPLGFFLAGWPTLVSTGLASLYAMRLASAMAAVGFIALAFDTATRSRWAGALRIGLVLALTPLALWLSGTVNPSGPAIAAGTAAWVGGFVLISDDVGLRGHSGLVRWAAPFCIFLLLRRDSLLWGALMIVVMLALISAPRLRALLQRRDFWAWAAAIVVCAVLQLTLWGGQSAGGFASNAATGGHATLAFQDTFKNVAEMIGNLGWLDSPVPDVVYLAWLGLILTMAVVAISCATRRMRDAVVLVLLLTVGAITGLGALQHGYLQGRYVLPFSIGLPLMSVIGIAERDDLAAFLDVLRRSLLWLLPLLQTLAFAQLLRRYSVGEDGPYSFLWHSKWAPPYAPIGLLCLLFAGASWVMYRVLLGAGSRVDQEAHISPVSGAASS
jgi:Predicted membrane protein (DUF2142)